MIYFAQSIFDRSKQRLKRTLSLESDFYKIFNADKFELLMSKYYLTGALTLLIFNIIFEEKIRNTFITFSNVSEDYEIVFI